MFGSCDNQRFGAQFLILGFYTKGIRKRSPTRFLRIKCVRQTPNSFDTLISSNAGRAASPCVLHRAGKELKASKKNRRRQANFAFQKSALYVRPSLCFQSQIFINIRPRKPHRGTSL